MVERETATSSTPFRNGRTLLVGTPELYRKNAFRLTGLSVLASSRDLARLGERLDMLHRLHGDAPPSHVSFPTTPAPSMDEVRDSLQQLREPEQRIIDEFFWFWPSDEDTAADAALSALGLGDVSAAAEAWNEDLASPRTRAPALHNLAILEHIALLEPAATTGVRDQNAAADRWRSAYGRWLAVLAEDSVWTRMTARIRAIDDPRLPVAFGRELRDAVPAALLQINVALARGAVGRGDRTAATLNAIAIRESGCDRQLVTSACKRLIEPDVNRIAALCDAALATTRQDVKSAAQAAVDLIQKGREQLSTVALLVPASDQRREEIHDKVANSALSCLVAYANATEDWRMVIPLTEQVAALASSEEVKATAAKNLTIAKGNLQSSVCWFCKTRDALDASAHKIAMFGDVEREFNRVKWREHDVKVPRCSECAAAHARTTGYATVGTVLGTLLGFVGCAAIVDNAGPGAFVVSAAGLGLGRFIGRRIARMKGPAGVAPLSNALLSPGVLELRRLGWQFGKRPANTN